MKGCNIHFEGDSVNRFTIYINYFYMSVTSTLENKIRRFFQNIPDHNTSVIL